MKLSVSQLFKIVSIILITAALGLELWNSYLYFHQAALPTNLQPLFLLANIVLFVHAIEGIIAAINVRNRNRLFYGVYTFFVGYIGLKELSER